MRTGPWNHNIHYHDIVLRSVPPSCRRALDVGCGQGLLTRRLAGRCAEVIGIDIDPETLVGARAASRLEQNVTFIQGDVMTHLLPSFDLIVAVATLHHLPLRPALARFQELLRPGGVLAVIGLYRAHALEDYVWSAVAHPSSWILRCLRSTATVGAPVLDPTETLHEIRTVCNAVLPGAALQRHLLFRYSLLWRKP
jgi:2-polyprenyl-3-methyl-5-hydroxy-6-metoxy-1,4-benzoquinol methylase